MSSSCSWSGSTPCCGRSSLTFARYEVLRLLSFSSAGAMPMTRLGSLLQVHPTSVTSAVDRLERQGYVERQRQDDDRRVVLASITDAGRAVVEKATDGLNGEVFERPGLTSAQLADLTAPPRRAARRRRRPRRLRLAPFPVGIVRDICVGPTALRPTQTSRTIPSTATVRQLLGRPTI